MMLNLAEFEVSTKQAGRVPTSLASVRSDQFNELESSFYSRFASRMMIQYNRE